jgi:hypothetical protein
LPQLRLHAQVQDTAVIDETLEAIRKQVANLDLDADGVRRRPHILDANFERVDRSREDHHADQYGDRATDHLQLNQNVRPNRSRT